MVFVCRLCAQFRDSLDDYVCVCFCEVAVEQWHQRSRVEQLCLCNMHLESFAKRSLKTAPKYTWYFNFSASTNLREKFRLLFDVALALNLYRDFRNFAIAIKGKRKCKNDMYPIFEMHSVIFN